MESADDRRGVNAPPSLPHYDMHNVTVVPYVFGQDGEQ